MTPDQAAWVRAHALTSRIIDGAGGPELLALCACQYGQSGHCARGRCDHCAHRTEAGRSWYDRGAPAAYLCSRSGGVLAEVWPIGRPCRWRCSCTCHTAVVEESGTLFDLEAA